MDTDVARQLRMLALSVAETQKRLNNISREIRDWEFGGDLSVPKRTSASRGSAGRPGRVIFNSDDGQLNVDDGSTWVSGTTVDEDAIHDNVAGEISALSSKTAPVSADSLVIEDSEDSNNKKKLLITNLPAGSPAADSITNVELANMATDTIKGRNTVGTGDPEDLTVSEVLLMLGVEAGATADQTAGEIEGIVSHDNLQAIPVNDHIDWTQDQGATDIHAGNIPEEEMYALQYDDVGSGVAYLGEAAVGAVTSAAVWRIKKIVETAGDIVVTWADGDSDFDNIWDNRLSLSYS